MRGSGTVNGGRGGGRIQLCATVTSDSIIHSLPTLGSTMISRENTDFDLNRDE